VVMLDFIPPVRFSREFWIWDDPRLWICHFTFFFFFESHPFFLFFSQLFSLRCPLAAHSLRRCRGSLFCSSPDGDRGLPYQLASLSVSRAHVPTPFPLGAFFCVRWLNLSTGCRTRLVPFLDLQWSPCLFFVWTRVIFFLRCVSPPPPSSSVVAFRRCGITDLSSVVRCLFYLFSSFVERVFVFFSFLSYFSSVVEVFDRMACYSVV